MDNHDIPPIVATFLKLPWKGFALSIAGGFIAATVVSVGVGKLIPYKPGKSSHSVSKSSLSPQLDLSMSNDQVQKVLDRNLFNIDGEYPKEEEKKKEEEVYTGDEAIRSKLPLKLVGTIFGGDPYSGLALIEDSGRKAINSFMVGDMLTKGAKLIEIWREKIIIDMGDHREFIELERKELAIRRSKKSKKATEKQKPRYAVEPPPDEYKEEGFERSGSDIVISKDFRKKLLTVDFAKVLQDAKAEPNFKGGELAGFKLTRIRTDSIYEKAGLQNNDIVREVNGVPLNDTAQAIKLLNSLRGEGDIEVRLERGGAPMTVTLQVR